MKLMAKLNDTGSKVLCGVCGRELARVSDDRRRLHFEEGWEFKGATADREPTGRGPLDLWYRSKHARTRGTVRRRWAVVAPDMDFERTTERLPARVICPGPGCGRKQDLDPKALRLTIWRDVGYADGPSTCFMDSPQA